MHTDNLFEWLGSALGGVIRSIIHALQYVVGGLGAAVGDFVGGLAGALGMSPSAFHIALLVVGLLLLYGAVRAFMRRSILGGVILLVIAVVVLGGLVR